LSFHVSNSSANVRSSTRSFAADAP
jgi:hypothetical protein